MTPDDLIKRLDEEWGTAFGDAVRALRAEADYFCEESNARQERADAARAALSECRSELKALMDYHATCHGGTEDQLRARAEQMTALARRLAEAMDMHPTLLECDGCVAALREAREAGVIV